MKKICFLLFTLFFFTCASLYAQVTIGELIDPKSGALLDLNTSVKGGLLLSNVNIPSLDFIPSGDPKIFPDVDLDSLDTNWALRGAVVYNTNSTIGSGVYAWTGKYWMQVAEIETTEQIFFKISTLNSTYYLPTRGYVSSTYDHAYDWDISIDGAPDVHYQGTGSETGGISLSLPASGSEHLIRITPHNAPFPGWGNAFGHANKKPLDADKIISIEAPLTTLAFAPKATESNASYMFAYLFNGCTNLIAPAELKDNYKLPGTVTDLSYFFAFAYEECEEFIAPQNFTPLSDWLNGNNSIKNLSNFLRAIHYNNTNLKDPISLNPFSGWFSANSSITDLSSFLYKVHQLCSSLEIPMNLSPLSGWFNANTSITNLSDFFNATYHISSNLKNPMNLSPLSGWFSANTSITDLSYFFNSTYQECDKLTAPVNLIPLSGWFSATNARITNLSYFLYQTHYKNSALRLSGQKIFPEWIINLENGSNRPIKDVFRAFSATFGFDTNDSEKIGDTGEPQFENSNVLSSLGMPASNKVTYQKRRDISPANSNWK